MVKRGILIASGECEIENIEVNKDDVVIAVDGGLHHCRKMGLEPTWILGDFDSLQDKNVLQEYPQDMIRTLPCEKDDTDTIAALKFCMELGIKEFVIYGAMGGRLSHTMANIQSMAFLARNGLFGRILDKNVEMFVMENDKYSFTEEQTGIISVFSLDKEARGVTISGCKYEVSDVTLTNDFPLGVSNEFVGTAGCISVKEGTLLVLIEKNQ